MEGRLAVEEAPEVQERAIERARRRIRDRYYDRPEVRRTLASLILHRAAQGTLVGRSRRSESA